ncbi:uncharacterized protein L203_105191 [Cryptococcus depauperatus CBS 7841]|uniref:Uncharacterized protein n=1 Tax=Cryptococcus depauperatus CBS 7841 TaxID=1295531 RepID=A0A1E3HXJ8_9TREE|nr:cytoplasmic protein [Cryptococcus depauperatus CBS 7841]
MANQKPTQEDLEDVVYSARFGDIDEVKKFVEQFGKEALEEARDERGNTVLHMCCANGHLEVLEYLFSLVSTALLSTTNEAGSPPLHWAVMNNHVECVKALVNVPEDLGGGIQLLKQKNASGRDAFLESIFAGEGKEEVSGWIEGYLYKAEGCDDEESAGKSEEVKMEEGDEIVRDEARVVDELAEKANQLGLKASEEGN